MAPHCVMLRVILLFTGFVVAQSQICYYPDGLTVSTDIPCNDNAETSACCPSDSFCMGNGLCFNSGITSRGSCTDQAWKSGECTAFCTNTSISTSVPLTPCDVETNTFVCDLNSTNCQNDRDVFSISTGTSFVLRQSQVAALVANSNTVSNTGKTYSVGAMAGLGLGIGLPLSFALMLALFALRKEKQRSGPKLMYKPADEPGVHMRVLHSKPSSAISISESMTTLDSTYKPYQPRIPMQQYEYYKNPFVTERGHDMPVYEIGSSSPPYSEEERVEVPEKRFSK